jgi:hypothetical protein
LPYGSDGKLGWTSNPRHLAFILDRSFGTRVGVEHADGDNLVALVAERLRSGFAAVLLGQSAVSRHARLAFEPAEERGRLFVHDPKYPEVTGTYDYVDLPDFMRISQVTIY